ncbi:MAG: hypothetical protein NZ699_17205 [Roseiflexus sp.]|nr:hypothetical protein [Roseiflexus sp.]MCS7290861.1 hypothetical protein [Roseiflexus sp.]MDW8146312.1 hypothetical protein [Roseiflexaceae bacterium]MDW8234610.1 hypothetical protein [Roseiflexaceae bacterium]
MRTLPIASAASSSRNRTIVGRKCVRIASIRNMLRSQATATTSAA